MVASKVGVVWQNANAVIFVFVGDVAGFLNIVLAQKWRKCAKVDCTAIFPDGCAYCACRLVFEHGYILAHKTFCGKLFNACFFEHNLSMAKSFVSRLLNTFFSTLGLALLLFALFRHYFAFRPALLLALIAAVVVWLIFSWIFAFGRKKWGLAAGEKQKMEDVAQALYLADQRAVLAFFEMAAKRKFEVAKQENGWIVCDGVAFCPIFCKKVVDVFLVRQALEHKPKQVSKLSILCIDAEAECESLGAMICKKEKVFAFLKSVNIFPKTKVVTKKRQHKLIRNIFARKNFFRYLFLAFVFSFSTLFVPYKKLYIVFTGIVVFLGFCCLIFGKKKTEESAF